MGFYSAFKNSDLLKTRYFVALALFIAMSFTFAGLADEVHDGDTLTTDRAILTTIHQTVSSPTLDTIFSVGTNLSGVPVLVVATIVVAAFLYVKNYRSKALFLGMVMAGTGLANLLLKATFARQRPELWDRIVNEATFSFPSGHAMGSMAVAMTAVLLTWHTRWRIPVLLVSTLFVLFIGFSRLYLGVHYPSDVLAGWLLAAGWVATLFILMGLHRRTQSVSGEKRASSV